MVKTDEELKSIAKERWSFKSDKTDEELKKVSKDLYNGLIFCDRQCPSSILTTFMVLTFMGPQSPKNPSDGSNKEDKRDNVIYDLVQRDEDQKLYEFEKEEYSKYLNEIGLIYEYLDTPNRSPMSVNGMPCFFSCRFLSKEETKKMFEYYEKYKSIRETADNF